MEVMTRRKYVCDEGEIMDPHSKTEQQGFIPLDVQIQNMMIAGENLSEFRKGNYDLSSDVDGDDEPVEIARTKGFDPADITAASNAVEPSIRATVARVKAEAEKASEKSVEKLPEDANPKA